jgi:hypothetical protein
MDIHGRWRVATTPSRVLVFKAWDCWNEEAANQFAAEVRQAAKPFLGQRWAVFADLLCWGLAVPEVEPIMQELNTWGVSQGACRVVEVTGHHTLTEYQRKRIVIDTPPGFDVLVCDSIEEGVVWMNAKGFPLTAEQVQLEQPTNPISVDS